MTRHARPVGPHRQPGYPEGSANCMIAPGEFTISERRAEIMLTRKKCQEIFNMAMGAFKNLQQIGLSEGVIPYSPGSDEYPGWNDGWKYVRDIHLSKTKSNSYPMSG